MARLDATLGAMQIVSALFVENFAMRQAPGPSTRIDLTGAMFSMAAPTPAPVTITPHLVALIYCPPDEPGSGVFEVIFRRGISEEAFETIKDDMKARGCEDIVDAVEVCNGRAFINEDFAESELASQATES